VINVQNTEKISEVLITELHKQGGRRTRECITATFEMTWWRL